jgi:hypothetical protein
MPVRPVLKFTRSNHARRLWCGGRALVREGASLLRLAREGTNVAVGGSENGVSEECDGAGSSMV